MYFQFLKLIIEKLREVFNFKASLAYPYRSNEKMHPRLGNNICNITVTVHNNVQGSTSKSIIRGRGSIEDFIGTIKLFAGNYAPEGWLICDGRLLSTAQYSALFSVIGTVFGGDGIETFALPDMKGKCAAGAGKENSEIFDNKKPALSNKDLLIATLVPIVSASGDLNCNTTSTEQQSFEIISPSISINYIICWHGIYPSASNIKRSLRRHQ